MPNNISVEYKGTEIYNDTETGHATLKTEGKYMESDVEIDYEMEEGGGLGPQLIVLGPVTGSTVTATKGSTSISLIEEVAGRWTGYLTEYGIWTITSSGSGGTLTDTVNAIGSRQYQIVLQPNIYGVRWTGGSSPAFVRTDAAAEFTDPVPYVAGSTEYGSPFDDIYPWSDMTRVTDSEAGELVKIPKFWYKLTQSGSSLAIQISNAYSSGYSVCPACMDRGDGHGERDFIYIGRYFCSATERKSLTGHGASNPSSSAIHVLGNTIYGMDYLTLFTIWLLYLVEFASWNSQAKIGYGQKTPTSNISSLISGDTDSMPYHTGTMAQQRSVNASAALQYRYIENLFGSLATQLFGCYMNSSRYFYISKDPSKFDSTTDGIYTGTNLLPSTSGWLKTCKVNSGNLEFPIFIFTEVGGANSTYITDYIYTNTLTTGKMYLLYGSGSNTSTSVLNEKGLFGLMYYVTSSHPGSAASRLIKLP